MEKCQPKIDSCGQLVKLTHSYRAPRKGSAQQQCSGFGRGFGGLDLGKEDVADVVPIGDEGQGGMRVLAAAFTSGVARFRLDPRETHEQLRLSPRRLEGIGDGTLELARRSQPERMAIFVQSSDVKGTMLRSVRHFAGS